MQQYPQIESGNVDDVALLYVLDPPQKAAPYTAPCQDKGQKALQLLAQCAQKCLALALSNSGTVPVYHITRFNIAMPAYLSRMFQFTDAATATVWQILQNSTAVIALVRSQIKGLDNVGRIFLALDRTQLGLSVIKGGGNGRGVALIRRTYHCRNNHQSPRIPSQPHAQACRPCACDHL